MFWLLYCRTGIFLDWQGKRQKYMLQGRVGRDRLPDLWHVSNYSLTQVVTCETWHLSDIEAKAVMYFVLDEKVISTEIVVYLFI